MRHLGRGSRKHSLMSTAFIHNEAPGSGLDRAGGSDWHKIDCNDRYIDFTLGAQA